MVTAPTRRRRRTRATRPTTARLAITSGLAPRLTDALLVAEHVRKALLRKSDGASIFSGHDDARKPQRGHPHTFILPEANSDDGRMTHVTLYASAGFSQGDRAAIENLPRLFLKGGELTVVLLDIGHCSAFAGFDARAGECPLLATSRVWISHTPFVATRHPKAYRDGRPKLDDTGLQIGCPEHDLRRLMKANGIPEPSVVESVKETVLAGRPVRWTRFRTRRSDGNGARSNGAGSGFRLEFAEPWSGPLVLGYGAHFGLGVFKATR